ncbi:MAG: hypothetical protein AB3X44_06650 [Leptothrix sp. (in: b-proteobacteria)]
MNKVLFAYAATAMSLACSSIAIAQTSVGAISEKPGGARMANQNNSASKQEQIDRDNERKMQNEMNQNKGKGDHTSSTSSSSGKGGVSAAK